MPEPLPEPGIMAEGGGVSTPAEVEGLRAESEEADEEPLLDGPIVSFESSP